MIELTTIAIGGGIFLVIGWLFIAISDREKTIAMLKVMLDVKERQIQSMAESHCRLFDQVEALEAEAETKSWD